MRDNSKYKELMRGILDDQITNEFVSTRGAPDRDFWDSVITGVDEKGGLLMPGNELKFTDEFLEALPELSINEISANVLRNFIPRESIDDDRLAEMMQIAHNFDLPLEILNESTYILRLDQGPTASFKDVAARALAQLMEAHCEKYQKQLNLVVATSGDTGVAIVDAFGGSQWVTVTVMYPTDGVSPPQEKQMLNAGNTNKNVQMLPMKGNFDNCQDISKTMQMIKNLAEVDESEIKKREANGEEVNFDYLDERIEDVIDSIKLKFEEAIKKQGLNVDKNYILEIKKTLDDVDLGSANSISWWRLAPQIVQYVTGIAKAIKAGKLEKGEKFVYAVPSGNVGHLTAGLIAMEGGLPIKKFIVGTNANNVLKGLINEGVIRHPGFQPTSSPSMDIGDPNNYERILYFVAKKLGHVDYPVDYAGMKNTITRLDNQVKALRSKIEEMEKNQTLPAQINQKRNELNDLLAEKIDLREFGVTAEMIKFLRKIIVVEDVVTDEETYAAMRYTAEKTGVVMEPHGVTAKVATDRARAKGLVGQKDKVIILETAHPDKFPKALEEAGLLGSKISLKPIERTLQKMDKKILNSPLYQGHPKLDELEQLNVEEMNKPNPLELNILEVAKKIREISHLNKVEISMVAYAVLD